MLPWTSELQEHYRQAVGFAQSELAQVGSVEHFDLDGWRRCARHGVMAITVPKEFGGRGESIADFVATMDGLGCGTNRLGLLFAISAHVFGAVEPICRAATDLQKRKYLPELASGRWVAAHGVTEPTGGSDIQSLQTTAERTQDGWRLNGIKHCITCAASASLHVIYARSGENALSCFLVEAGTPGVSAKPLQSCGLVGCGLGTVHLKDVLVPDENLLGQPGAGGALVQGSIERERACIWGFVVGAMQRDLDRAIDYAKSRHVGGKPISTRQAISHRIADMKLRLYVSRLLLYHVTMLKAANKRTPMEAALAKLYISESFVENSLGLLRVYGGNGYLFEGGVERSVRDALGGILFSGTNDVQRNIVASCLGLDA